MRTKTRTHLPNRAARTALSPRVDALGNPLGGPHAGGDSGARDEDDFDGGLKTAADYGLPEWDEDEETDEDVDDVVDPLADGQRYERPRRTRQSRRPHQEERGSIGRAGGTGHAASPRSRR